MFYMAEPEFNPSFFSLTSKPIIIIVIIFIYLLIAHFSKQELWGGYSFDIISTQILY